MRIDPDQLDRLRNCCEVRQAGWGNTGVRLSESELCEQVGDAEILLVGYEKISARVIASAPHLRLIGCARGNPVNIDIAAAQARGIKVLHTPGRNAAAAAEFTLGLIISLARFINRSERELRSGLYLGEPRTNFSDNDNGLDITWNLDGDSPYKRFCGVELYGKTLGLIGMGNVAIRVARLAQAFGMKVTCCTPAQDRQRALDLDVQPLELDDLLGSADFVSIHCKATAETEGLIDARALALMKPSAFLINTARAMIVDQSALVAALRENRIAGAALDVFWHEPLPKNDPLLSMDNVILTPHLGGAASEVISHHSQMLVEDVLTWLDGGMPAHLYPGGK